MHRVSFLLFKLTIDTHIQRKGVSGLLGEQGGTFYVRRSILSSENELRAVYIIIHRPEGYVVSRRTIVPP